MLDLKEREFKTRVGECQPVVISDLRFQISDLIADFRLPIADLRRA